MTAAVNRLSTWLSPSRSSRPCTPNISLATSSSVAAGSLPQNLAAAMRASSSSPRSSGLCSAKPSSAFLRSLASTVGGSSVLSALSISATRARLARASVESPRALAASTTRCLYPSGNSIRQLIPDGSMRQVGPYRKRRECLCGQVLQRSLLQLAELLELAVVVLDSAPVPGLLTPTRPPTARRPVPSSGPRRNQRARAWPAAHRPLRRSLPRWDPRRRTSGAGFRPPARGRDACWRRPRGRSPGSRPILFLHRRPESCRARRAPGPSRPAASRRPAPLSRESAEGPRPGTTGAGSARAAPGAPASPAGKARSSSSCFVSSAASSALPASLAVSALARHLLELGGHRSGEILLADQEGDLRDGPLLGRGPGLVDGAMVSAVGDQDLEAVAHEAQPVVFTAGTGRAHGVRQGSEMVLDECAAQQCGRPVLAFGQLGDALQQLAMRKLGDVPAQRGQGLVGLRGQHASQGDEGELAREVASRRVGGPLHVPQPPEPTTATTILRACGFPSERLERYGRGLGVASRAHERVDQLDDLRCHPLLVGDVLELGGHFLQLVEVPLQIVTVLEPLHQRQGAQHDDGHGQQLHPGPGGRGPRRPRSCGMPCAAGRGGCRS